MNAQIVHPGCEAEILHTTEQIIFSRRPSIHCILAVIGAAPQVNKIYVSPSYFACLSKNVRKLCELRGITLVSKNVVQGRKEGTKGELVDIKEDENI